MTKTKTTATTPAPASAYEEAQAAVRGTRQRLHDARVEARGLLAPYADWREPLAKLTQQAENDVSVALWTNVEDLARRGMLARLVPGFEAECDQIGVKPALDNLAARLIDDLTEMTCWDANSTSPTTNWLNLIEGRAKAKLIQQVKLHQQTLATRWNQWAAAETALNAWEAQPAHA